MNRDIIKNLKITHVVNAATKKRVGIISRNKSNLNAT